MRTQKPQLKDVSATENKPLELMVEFEDAKGQKQAVDWFKCSRAYRRTIKQKAPALWEKIEAAKREMLAEKKEGNSEEV